MFCPHCGASARDDHAYCHGCGAHLRATRVWPAAAQPTGLRRLAGEPGIRLLAYGAAGVLAIIVLSAMLKALITLAVPLLLVAFVVYWVRERGRGYS